MSRLPSITGLQAIETFERAGFQIDRIKGSHHVLVKEGHPYRLSVPVHKNDTLPRGTLTRLIRDAGLTVEEFNKHRK
ncbi:MAG: type II toxin-antitoxin system HicA family toxin [Planctomycetes bacterium]|nr:type II toxin-antitoxin system HicA family toxin [Planctomycetota bacterium]